MPEGVSYQPFDLYQQVSMGKEDAFKALFDQYVPRLQAMHFRITRSASVADDLVQETLLKVWIARDQLAKVALPDAWIMKIGFFLAVNYVRRQATRQKVMDTVRHEHTPAPRHHAQEDIDFNQLLALVSKAVQELPEKQRNIYQLNRERGLTATEIARETGLAVSTVKNLLVMALKHIRTFLQNAGYLLPFLAFFLRSFFF